MLERLGRLLTRGAGAEVAAADHEVAAFYRVRKGGLERVHAVLCDLVDTELHVAAGHDGVGVDVVAEDPGLHARSSRGAAMRPATADAVTVYGDARYTGADAAPMRPLKLRAV